MSIDCEDMKGSGNVTEFPAKMAVDPALNTPEAVAARMNLVESITKAEDAVRRTLCGLNMIAGIQITAVGAADDNRHYVGEITMLGQDGILYGQTIEGPEIKAKAGRKWGDSGAIDSRRDLMLMLREMADEIYKNMQEHP